jgi:hypothetical protein
MMPTTAIAMPTTFTGAGRSPATRPMTTGTSTPIAAIGATTPMRPRASAA